MMPQMVGFLMLIYPMGSQMFKKIHHFEMVSDVITGVMTSIRILGGVGGRSNLHPCFPLQAPEVSQLQNSIVAISPDISTDLRQVFVFLTPKQKGSGKFVAVDRCESILAKPKCCESILAETGMFFTHSSKTHSWKSIFL